MTVAPSPALAGRTRLVRLTTALLAVALTGLVLAAGTSSAAGRPGQGPGDVAILLRLHHPQGLADFVRSVSDPKSPDYGNYQSVPSIAARFGASSGAKKATLQWLREHGAKAKLGPTGTYVVARVPTSVAAFSLPSTGAATDLHRIPAKLRAVVDSISTLGTKQGAFGSDVTTATDELVAAEPGYKGTSIFANTGTPSGCTEGREAELLPGDKAFTPNEYLDAYGHSKLHKLGYKGQGQSIAVIEIDGFRHSDVETFAKCFGLPSPNLQVRPVGIPKPLPPGDETTLDLEVLTAVAPKLRHLYVYEGGSSEEAILHTVAVAVGAKGDRPDAISISLGSCEADLYAQVAFRETLDEVFAVAGGAGISVLASSGDQGSSACTRPLPTGETALPLLSANDPATSPFVTAVGGTNVELSKGNRIKREVVWNDAPLALGAGGGGASILSTPRPWWQQGLLNGLGNGRLVPDVAGLADVAPGYAIYCTAPECVSPEVPGGWHAVGGTSAAAPLYAGGVVLADDYNEAHGVPTLGLLNPLLYEVGRETRPGKRGGGVLHDVTEGNNDAGIMLPEDAGGGHPLGCCVASKGFDAASGWGSLDVSSLAKVATSKLNAARVERTALAAAERRAVEAAERTVEEVEAEIEARPER